MNRRFWTITAILLLAAALRLALLAHIPPGMTHDEADHGLDAWGVVNGIRPIYFTVGYGREPLYDYSTAALMAFLGPTFLAGRLTSVFYSLILIAGSYAWVRRAFSERVATLTALGLTLGFWPLMTARHALRSVTMPALFTLVAALYWGAVYGQRKKGQLTLAGLLLGITFYTYMPARIMWFLFPALLGWWALTNRPQLRAQWRGTLWMLFVAALVAAPLFYHLQTTPAEIRLDQLRGPIDSALSGDFEPLLANITASLRLFTIEGDSLWRYNIPARPLLQPIMGFLFYGGLLVALFNLRKMGSHTGSAAAFALMWLVGGFVPALVTGPEAATTRIIAMQPILYLLPALALDSLRRWLASRPKVKIPHLAAPFAAGLLFLMVGVESGRAYFGEWAHDSDVRVQYEATRVTTIDYLNQHGSGVVALSSPRPSRFHYPSTALMTLRNPDVDLRWFDARHSLLLPNASQSTLIFSGWAPLDPALAAYLTPKTLIETLPMAANDKDKPVQIFSANTQSIAAHLTEKFMPPPAPVTFGIDQNVQLLGWELLTPDVRAGETVRIASLWQAQQAIENAILFTHLQAADGSPLAQADRLDAPSFYWQSGDYFVQLHDFILPDSIESGAYPLAIGWFLRGEGNPRLPLFSDGQPTGDIYQLGMLEVVE